jgi:hypothetical protein
MDQYIVYQNDGQAPREFGNISQDAMEAIVAWVRSGARLPEGCVRTSLLDWHKKQQAIRGMPADVWITSTGG